MTDGHWTIKQYAPTTQTGFTVTVIPVRPDPDAVRPDVSSPTEPWWLHTTMEEPCLAIVWPDGREEYFPWASIVHAEYQPPT